AEPVTTAIGAVLIDAVTNLRTLHAFPTRRSSDLRHCSLQYGSVREIVLNLIRLNYCSTDWLCLPEPAAAHLGAGPLWPDVEADWPILYCLRQAACLRFVVMRCR